MTNGSCAQCICPDYFNGDCCEEPVEDICTENPCSSSSSEFWNCTAISPGQRECKCQEGFTGDKCDTDVDPCDTFTCYNGGTCKEDITNGTMCQCPKDFSGTYCDVYKLCTLIPPKCDTYDCSSKNPCKNGGTCYYNNAKKILCVCPDGFTGADCSIEQCTPGKCFNGGRCYLDDNGFAACDCLSIWKGNKCERFDSCQFWTCKYGGTCLTYPNNTAYCQCVTGYDGPHCGAIKDNCEPNPCVYEEFGVKNETTCKSIFADFKCDCPAGTSGKDCSGVIDDCNRTGVAFKDNRCNTVDKGAVCLDGLNEYRCVCSANYTGQNCAMSMIVWKVAQAFGGLDDVINLLEDVVQSPSLIKDLMPFLLGQLDKDNQSAMSWGYKDLFVWASYEKNELSPGKDFYQSFDTTLGNCFTFNHHECPRKWSSRKSGLDGGFQALMRVRQDQYLAWIDTASLLVFVHPPEESIFAESVRYQASPNTSTMIIPIRNAYSRLDGKYGTCIKNVSEVGSYYYTGDYTTAGCFRGCYQDAVLDECGCMDPRYAMPKDANACNLTLWNCVKSITDTKGDASTWTDCKCPSPCSESQFDSAYAKASFPSYFFDCDEFMNDTDSTLYDYCMGNYTDMVLISVFIPRLTRKVFAETPAMSLTSFLSNVGGIAGLFIGFSMVTIFDFSFIFIWIGWVLCKKGEEKRK
uniref:EGF-like domain-containing protein n=1 Tax=Panagrolaimus sp. PS1159 TaxID=55785 RepID=A0AC35GI66_9BILA